MLLFQYLLNRFMISSSFAVQIHTEPSDYPSPLTAFLQ